MNHEQLILTEIFCGKKVSNNPLMLPTDIGTLDVLPNLHGYIARPSFSGSKKGFLFFSVHKTTFGIWFYCKSEKIDSIQPLPPSLGEVDMQLSVFEAEFVEQPPKKYIFLSDVLLLNNLIMADYCPLIRHELILKFMTEIPFVFVRKLPKSQNPPWVSFRCTTQFPHVREIMVDADCFIQPLPVFPMKQLPMVAQCSFKSLDGYLDRLPTEWIFYKLLCGYMPFDTAGMCCLKWINIAAYCVQLQVVRTEDVPELEVVHLLSTSSQDEYSLLAREGDTFVVVGFLSVLPFPSCTAASFILSNGQWTFLKSNDDAAGGEDYVANICSLTVVKKYLRIVQKGVPLSQLQLSLTRWFIP